MPSVNTPDDHLAPYVIDATGPSPRVSQVRTDVHCSVVDMLLRNGYTMPETQTCMSDVVNQSTTLQDHDCTYNTNKNPYCYGWIVSKLS